MTDAQLYRGESPCCCSWVRQRSPQTPGGAIHIFEKPSTRSQGRLVRSTAIHCRFPPDHQHFVSDLYRGQSGDQSPHSQSAQKRRCFAQINRCGECLQDSKIWLVLYACTLENVCALECAVART